MTKPTGKGRGKGGGGRKAGAGRPRKKGAAFAALPPPDIEIIVPPSAWDEMADPHSAKEMRGLALKTLKNIMQSSPADAPRVSAAKEVLARAAAEEAAASGTTGKKAAAQATAEMRNSEGGVFAVPPPPPGLRVVK